LSIGGSPPDPTNCATANTSSVPSAVSATIVAHTANIPLPATRSNPIRGATTVTRDDGDGRAKSGASEHHGKVFLWWHPCLPVARRANPVVLHQWVSARSGNFKPVDSEHFEYVGECRHNDVHPLLFRPNMSGGDR